MAFPAVVGTPTESATTTDATTHTINRPAGVSGQLTIVIIGFDGGNAVVFTPPSGYTNLLFRLDQSTNHGSVAYWHAEDGTEGTSTSWTTDDSEKLCAIVYSISGAAVPGTQPPEATTFSFVSASANPDPPSLTPTGGAKDYLWIAGFNQNGEEANDDTWVTAVPTNYGTARQTTTGTGGIASTNCALATADRNLNAASEDPATFTAAAQNYTSFTIAIHPAGAAAASLIYPPRMATALIVR